MHQINLKKIYFPILILTAFIFRLFLITTGFHIDMLSMAGWGEWIYSHGPLNFYQNSVWTYSWPTQPPLISLLYSFCFFLYFQLFWIFTQISFVIVKLHLFTSQMLWWFDFAKWFATVSYPETYFKYGVLIVMKLLAILGDLALGTIIYYLAKNQFNQKKALLFAAAFLFFPFSWYISALWGQYDGLSFLFLLGSLLLLRSNKLGLLAPIFFCLSFGIKPTSLIFAPLFLWVYFRLNISIAYKLCGLLLGLLISLLSVAPFASRDIFNFVFHDLMLKIFYKAEFRVGSSSFNFWRILIGDKLLNQDTPFLFISAKFWGLTAFSILNLVAFKITQKKSFENIIRAAFIIGLGSWLFLTNMLERYAFAGIVFGLMLGIYYPKLIKYWLVIAFIFSINLYYSWLFPPNFEFFHQALIWQNTILTKILAIINLAIFGKMVWEIQPKVKEKIINAS